MLRSIDGVDMSRPTNALRSKLLVSVNATVSSSCTMNILVPELEINLQRLVLTDESLI